MKTFFQRRLKLFTSPFRYFGTVGTLRVSLGTTWQSAAYSPSAVGLRLLRFRLIENYEREERKSVGIMNPHLLSQITQKTRADLGAARERFQL